MEVVHFTSLTFILFLAFFFGAYWSVKKPRNQNLILVIASYLFYGWWDYRFCTLILFSSLVDFYIGRSIADSNQPNIRKRLLAFSLISNLGLLAIFKYFGFFAANLQLLAQSLGWSLHPVTLDIILPVGISFYTFQTLSYTIDIYRDELKPAGSIIDYLAFVSFFPQLVAGPIERGKNLLPQFESPRTFCRSSAEEGCRWILWGFVKKLAIADPLAVVVDQYYGAWEIASGSELILATVFFAFQIYCDFSAYSDIAIGTARLFNIRLMRNFAYPYFSQNVGEFWRRWHISLSTWFRDYVYIPLGGSRVGRVRRAINLMLTFLLSGLWHGAAWNFVAWGGLHGAALAGQKQTKASNQANPAKQQTRLRKQNPDGQANRFTTQTPGGERFIPPPMVVLKIWLTFSLVCCGWVFFRAESISDAYGILCRVATDAISATSIEHLIQCIDKHETLLIILGLFIGFEWIRRRHACPLSSGRPLLAPVRWLGYTAMIWSTLYLVADVQEQPFVYFAF